MAIFIKFNQIQKKKNFLDKLLNSEYWAPEEKKVKIGQNK